VTHAHAGINLGNKGWKENTSSQCQSTKQSCNCNRIAAYLSHYFLQNLNFTCTKR